MSRKLVTVLIASCLQFAGVTTEAWSENVIASTPNGGAKISISKNQSPLPSGRAAGIREAQGTQRVLIGVGLAAAFIVVGWLVLDEDEEATSTTGPEVSS